MRTLFFLIATLVYANCLSASSQADFKGAGLNQLMSNVEEVQKENVLESVSGLLSEYTRNQVVKVSSEAQPNLFGKCTIKVHAEFDNGVVIEGTVVIEGIPWYECLAIKIYDLFSSDF